MTTGWQPIEMAPKDGQAVLGYVIGADWDVGEDCSSPRHETRPFVTEVYWEKHGGWVCSVDFHMAVDVTPTHWMPLPKPPEKEDSHG